MKTKLTTTLLALAGGIIVFANQTFAADATANSVSQTNEPSPFTIIVSPEKSRVHIKEVFKVELEVKNISNTNQSFAVMSCSWMEHWRSDNGQIGTWPGWACIANAPIKIELASGESWKKELKMWIPEPVSTNRVSFRMSFTPLPFEVVPPHVENGKYVWQKKKGVKTYWSSESSININPKWIPDWIP